MHSIVGKLALSCSFFFLASTTALAHSDLDGAGTHISRYGKSQIKQGPCGKQNGARGTHIYTYEPGATIKVAVDEFVPHP